MSASWPPCFTYPTKSYTSSSTTSKYCLGVAGATYCLLAQYVTASTCLRPPACCVSPTYTLLVHNASWMPILHTLSMQVKCDVLISTPKNDRKEKIRSTTPLTRQRREGKVHYHAPCHEHITTSTGQLKTRLRRSHTWSRIHECWLPCCSQTCGHVR
jgi:hypothetical protein